MPNKISDLHKEVESKGTVNSHFQRRSQSKKSNRMRTIELRIMTTRNIEQKESLLALKKINRSIKNKGIDYE